MLILSVPTLLGRNSIEKREVLNIHFILKLKKRKFMESANLMKEYIDRINTKTK